MPISQEMNTLKARWTAGHAWQQVLEWIEIEGIRGWTGQRVDFRFPIVALVGENGTGKSTILQAARSAYRSDAPPDLFASNFFPDTPFEAVAGSTIRFSYRQGNNSQTKTIRKPTDRWYGNPERPQRPVRYIDLSRIQPVGARTGFAKLLKNGVTEGPHQAFDPEKLGRLSQIVGKAYTGGGISQTNIDERRLVPVLATGNIRYSGFHQGAGEIAAAELLAVDFPNQSLILIDEIETSLHPRAQRRLVRDLARLARLKHLQIILTTHSPYVLEELPAEGRVYLMNGAGGMTAVTGVSPEFAMTRMDEVAHPECDVYVEDARAAAWIQEAVVHEDAQLVPRLQFVPYGGEQVGRSLGTMNQQNRFPRPSVVYLDGEQEPHQGCVVLPGGVPPERLIFGTLQQENWPGVPAAISRDIANTIDALNAAMLLDDHHRWLASAASSLYLGTDVLWQAMCAQWVRSASDHDLEAMVDPIRQKLQ